jgi:hypothetical protein
VLARVGNATQRRERNAPESENRGDWRESDTLPICVATTHQAMIAPECVDAFSRALADEIGDADPVVASLLLELVRRPGAQAHRSILLGNSRQWRELVQRAAATVSAAYVTESPPR